MFHTKKKEELASGQAKSNIGLHFGSGYKISMLPCAYQAPQEGTT